MKLIYPMSPGETFVRRLGVAVVVAASIAVVGGTLLGSVALAMRQ